MYRLTRRIAAAAANPLTLQEACYALRIEQGMDDAAVTSALEAAIDHIEQAYGLPGVVPVSSASSHEDLFDDWPELRGSLKLGRAEVSAVEFVRYTNSAGVELTFADWALAAGQIWLPYGKIWPTATLRTKAAAIRVRYTAGWATAAAVPEAIKQAIRLLMHHYYYHRDASQSPELSAAVGRILANYRRY